MKVPVYDRYMLFVDTVFPVSPHCLRNVHSSHTHLKDVLLAIKGGRLFEHNVMIFDRDAGVVVGEFRVDSCWYNQLIGAEGFEIIGMVEGRDLLHCWLTANADYSAEAV